MMKRILEFGVIGLLSAGFISAASSDVADAVVDIVAAEGERECDSNRWHDGAPLGSSG
jgi:hypothetical protein